MTPTGPPWFAADRDEAARAQAHLEQRGRRIAFAAALQARLRGNAARAKTTLDNWTPLRRTR